VTQLGEEADRVHPDERRTREARFEALYGAHFHRVYLYVYRRIFPATEDAEDIVAEVFAVAWRRLDEMAPPSGELMWLYGVARNLLMHHHRAVQRRSRLQTRLRRELTEDDREPSHSSDLVLRLLDRLHPNEREILRLTLWDGLSYNEAAELLDCSVSAIAGRAHRAKRRLRRQLASLGRTIDPSTQESETQND
jgi:RNA polymerase sigma factor (sigma-70 family)